MMGDTTNQLNALRFWATQPFALHPNAELTLALKKLDDSEPYSLAFNKALEDVEIFFTQNKIKYEYVQRRQVEKAILSINGHPNFRAVGNVVSSVVDKTIVPAFNSTVVPAAVVVGGFFRGLFKKTNQVNDEL